MEQKEGDDNARVDAKDDRRGRRRSLSRTCGRGLSRSRHPGTLQGQDRCRGDFQLEETCDDLHYCGCLGRERPCSFPECHVPSFTSGLSCRSSGCRCMPSLLRLLAGVLVTQPKGASSGPMQKEGRSRRMDRLNNIRARAVKVSPRELRNGRPHRAAKAAGLAWAGR